MSEWIAGEAIAEAVNAANLFRQKYGEPLIEDLPSGEPDEPERCILAKAFNFDCIVNGNSLTGVWSARFTKFDKDKADALAEILGTEVEEADPVFDNGVYRVALPDKIKNLAIQFDAGNLEAKYYTMNEEGNIEEV